MSAVTTVTAAVAFTASIAAVAAHPAMGASDAAPTLATATSKPTTAYATTTEPAAFSRSLESTRSSLTTFHPAPTGAVAPSVASSTPSVRTWKGALSTTATTAIFPASNPLA